MKNVEPMNYESERLAALNAYEILDTSPEPLYDNMAVLAAQICSTPIALVTLIDSTRQWFKSHYGTSISETPREISICTHTIRSMKTLIVEDTLKDARFVTNPLVTGETNIRFYAGVPLTTPEGHSVGTICVLDHIPRTMSLKQIQSLEILAKQVVADLELRKSHRATLHWRQFLTTTQVELEFEKAKATRNAKLASLGEIAAGIAHEINNPLAIISGSANLLSKIKDRPEEFEAKIKSISKSCERITRIVDSLRKFSRLGGTSKFEIKPLHSIIAEALVLVETKAKRHGTKVEFETTTNAAISCCDVEIEQVIINLVSNAIDAVEKQSERWVKLSLFERDSEIVLRVTDSGKGIPENAKNKLFEPFFTTKPVGFGTGLGLSIVRGILNDHKGKIEIVENSPNTCFEITFGKLKDAENVA